MKTVLLIPGHGGKDCGAVGGGKEEADLNLDIVLEAGLVLSNSGHDVHYTRSADIYISPSDQLKYIRQVNPDACVSVHFNASADPSANGVETIWADDYDEPLARSIHMHICALTGLRNRGMLRDGSAAYSRGLAVLKELTVPACLVELGFISNPEELAYILRNIKLYGAAIATGVAQYFIIQEAENGIR